MGDPFTTAIIITVAIAIFTERGKKEYGHTRDKAAAEFARAHPDWSSRKVMRHAKRRARGYWWDQISNGFPDYKRAHQESRELAKAERAEAEAGWMQRRAELRKRTADALDKKDRLHREDAERQSARLDEVKNAPCVFCGAAHGEDCKPDCPYRATRDANRANGGGSTVPPETGRTEPGPDSTVPPEPSHAGGTVPPDRATTEPDHRATPDRATEPLTGNGDEARTSFWRDDEEKLAVKERQLQDAIKAFGELRPTCSEKDIEEHEAFRARLETEIGQLRHALGKDQHDNVTPINRNQSAVNRQAGNENTNGGNVTAPNVTGEIAGYEAVLAEHDQTLAHLEAVHADADQKVHAFEQLDAVYENRINGLRQANADEETIGTQVTAREANETQISAAKAALEASSVHLEAETAARARWVSGIGSMKETADATGAEGDRVLRS